MDGNLYDEFGNYIGPEIEDEEEDDLGYVPTHDDEDMQDQEEAQAPEEEGVWSTTSLLGLIIFLTNLFFL